MIATRKGGTAVRRGDKLAGMRVIPLVIEEKKLRRAEQASAASRSSLCTPTSVKPPVSS